MSLTMNTLRRIAEWRYEKKPLSRGYNMRTLAIDLGAISGGKPGLALAGKPRAASNAGFSEKPVSAEMKKKFVGGKGFGLRLLWDGTKPSTKWDDPENEIVIAMGPVCGNTNYPGSGKSLVVSLSPMTGVPIDSNVGGYFGPFLKFSGFDALELTGKSERDLIVFLNGDAGTVEIFESPEGLESDTHILADKLTHAFAASEAETDLASVSVVSAGRGAEHTVLGLLNFSLYDRRRGGCRV
ncbi:MAG TPA: aldehyde:ferredoxin oxidoreductase, partial [Spirochaetaceae bacterium]|nr:aldehyde:ferredoxin oxidoreductase [Spirochaetaceae bacterium]